MSDATWVLEKEHCEAMSALAEEIGRIESKMMNEINCTDCILDGTDGCPREAGRAIDDEYCDEFIHYMEQEELDELIEEQEAYEEYLLFNNPLC